MKKIFIGTGTIRKTWIACSMMCACMLGLSSCGDDYNDSELRSDIENLEDRITALEEWQKSVNTDIRSLQSLVAALENKDYVTAVTPLEDGTGYVISFLKSGNITIKHGERGEQGEKGEDGTTPVISVKLDTDGKYYWTVNGEWLLDNGNKMPVTGEKGDKGDKGDNGASGSDGLTPYISDNGNWWIGTTDTGVKAQGNTGTDGQTPHIGDNGNWWIGTTDTGVKAQGDKGADAIAPQVRINTDTNKWEISTDGGKTWTSTGVKATGDKGAQGTQGPAGPSGAACGISNIEINGNNVIFTIGTGADAQQIAIPLCTSILTFNDLDVITKGNNTFTTESNLFSRTDLVVQTRVESKSADGTDILTRSASERWNISSSLSGNELSIKVNPSEETALNETAVLKVTVTLADGQLLASGQKVFANGIFTGVLSVSSLDDLMSQLDMVDKTEATDIKITGCFDKVVTSSEVIDLISEINKFTQIGTLEISVPQIQHLTNNIANANIKVFKSEYISSLDSDGGTFWNSAVEEVYLPNVTTLYQTEFSGCSSLRKVDLTNVTSVQGSQVFYNCSQLETLNLPNLETFGYLTYANFARGCYLLKEVNMPKVTSLPNSAFLDCYSLTHLKFPEVTTIGGSVFMNCTHLASVSLPKVAVLPRHTFAECISLNEIGGLKAVEEVGESAFSGCSALKTATLKTVKKIGKSAFAGCSKLNMLGLGCVAEIDATAFDGVDTESCGLRFWEGTPTAGGLNTSQREWCNKKWKTVMVF
ncbi:leucine-rich repeat protein [Phocaeicola sartorii]|uniref:DUF4988 domain-containing protein n=1 Tax=Phocaeicola sartorii TaxID=671267 RepID=R9I6R0_9BACT|nr:leucine-rich repeat protein [Phocaeicola sartorii]EOS11801.1 hypothetical protein C802_02914 [Phocaeicola sartorii]MCR1845580.1 leucine-rich repeat protein [Phocaeicola sartorii]